MSEKNQYIQQIVFSSHKWQSTTYWFKHADSKTTDSGYLPVSSRRRMILLHCSLLVSVSWISLMQLNVWKSWLQTIWFNACHSSYRVTCWVSVAEHVAVTTKCIVWNVGIQKPQLKQQTTMSQNNIKVMQAPENGTFGGPSLCFVSPLDKTVLTAPNVCLKVDNVLQYNSWNTSTTKLRSVL